MEKNKPASPGSGTFLILKPIIDSKISGRKVYCGLWKSSHKNGGS